MATPVTHAVTSLAAGAAVFGFKMSKKFWFFAAACAVAPDFDVIGLRLGIPYGHLLGHRGLSHSLAFALAMALLVMFGGLPEVRRLSRKWWAMRSSFS